MTKPLPVDGGVRRARPSDAPAVGLVQAEVFRDAYADVLPAEVVATFEPQAFAATWRRSLESPPAGVWTLLVATAGTQVAGTASVGPSQDPDADPLAAELHLLAVHPQARRMGHGSRLLKAAVDVLGEAGATSLAAWVLTTQDELRAFLQAAGFAPDGAHRERVVSPDGTTAREVRLVVAIEGR